MFSKLKIPIIFASGFFLSSVLMLMIFFALFFTMNRDNSNPGNYHETPSDYQYLQVNSHLDGATVGTVSIPQIIDEYALYADEEGNKMLVSEFGLEEYQCTGSCYCDEGRRNTKILSNAAFTLIAATSSIVAYKLAENAITKDCESSFYESCSVESIRSDVDECSTVEEMVSEASDENTKYYMCHGNCVEDVTSSGRRSSFSSDDGEDGKEFDGCSSKRQQAEVTVKPERGSDPRENLRKAETKFKENVLDPFCRTQPNSPNENEMTLAEWKELQKQLDPHWDLRGRRTCCGGKPINESIKCRETFGRGSCGKCEGDHDR